MVERRGAVCGWSAGQLLPVALLPAAVAGGLPGRRGVRLGVWAVSAAGCTVRVRGETPAGWARRWGTWRWLRATAQDEYLGGPVRITETTDVAGGGGHE